MADEENDAEEKPVKKGLPIKMIAVGLVIGLAVGGGVAFVLKPEPQANNIALSKERTEGSVGTENAEGGGEKGGGGGGGEGQEEGGGIYDLDPFIVNLADVRKIRYLKINIKLEMIRSGYSEDLTEHLPQIRDALLLLLSSKEFANIRTVEGKMELRDEILQRVNGIYKNNKVKMAYFTEFVTQ